MQQLMAPPLTNFRKQITIWNLTRKSQDCGLNREAEVQLEEKFLFTLLALFILPDQTMVRTVVPCQDLLLCHHPFVVECHWINHRDSHPAEK